MRCRLELELGGDLRHVAGASALDEGTDLIDRSRALIRFDLEFDGREAGPVCRRAATREAIIDGPGERRLRVDGRIPVVHERDAGTGEDPVGDVLPAVVV